ncbi:MAG TPA: hypothetical protein VFI15_05605 [Candidatus Limnocylindrales bacterium]|nr:hypothetical protein [Candidatus Limnocylindrales bacterium]
MTRRRKTAVLAAIAWTVALVAGGWYGLTALRIHAQTARVAARFDPPVLAGQTVTPGCSGGFYARKDQTIVLLSSAHCMEPGVRLRDGDGRVVGVLGPRAQLADCPPDRFCAPSDFMPLALLPDRIPWGHLNVVDMGAGGYRTIADGTRPFGCADLAKGAQVEVDGRERFRSGTIVATGPYDLDTIFPCMALTDMEVGTGDSGGAVLVKGQPAGIIARRINDRLGFTPLAEGLENLGLTLCTTPDCDLSPATAVQPTD